MRETFSRATRVALKISIKFSFTRDSWVDTRIIIGTAVKLSYKAL